MTQLNLDEYYKNLYMSPEFSDVIIKINNETIHAHKIVLSTRNEMFRNILKSNNNVLEIVDSDVQTFKAFLKYLYTDKVDYQDQTVNLMSLAEKYLDSKVKYICEWRFLFDIDLENAINRLSIGVNYNLGSLQRSARKFIVKHFDKLKESSNFELLTSDPKMKLSVMEEFNQTVKRKF